MFLEEVAFWTVRLDVWDLGVHLDFTLRARAGTLSKRVREATLGVASVWVFRLSLEWSVVSIFLQVSMLLKRLMSPPRPFVLSGLLLFVLCGPPRCLLPVLLLFLVFLMVLLELILLFMLFGPGSVWCGGYLA